ncbi:MAG: hypothetical protein ACRDJK_00265 [Actinomycetota bacterium]
MTADEAMLARALEPARADFGPIDLDAGPPPRHGPDEEPYWRVCEQKRSLAWRKIPSLRIPSRIRPGEPGFSRIERLANQLAAPAFSIDLSPSANGITGLESYFWLSGYDGGTQRRQVADAGQRIELRAIPSSYVWDFGDGTRQISHSTGRPYPERSEIRHMYETRSDRSPHAQPNGTYRIRATALFDVSFRVFDPARPPAPDEGWVTFSELGLEPLTATAERDYKVNEVRSVPIR